MLICSLTDAPWQDADLRAAFEARWGRESCILWGEATRSEFAPRTHTLSIRAAWGGTQYCHLDGRTVAVDDDTYLILNHGRVYGTSIRAARPVASLAICFAPALVEPLHSLSTVLEFGESGEQVPSDFFEHLQPHDTIVSPGLRRIRDHLRQGPIDQPWLAEQLTCLLASMQAHRRQVLERVARIQLARVATRREVYRRVSLATDFLHTNYAQPINLAMLAEACGLSKYHLLRLFKLVHGMTPQAFLDRKRVARQDA
jgi:AraC family transcriptional regulator